MAVVATLVGVVIAVAGWVASGVLARRAVRRQLRVEYLLSAYRRLEAASNRGMTGAHESAIESAVSDIQLLGSARQVELADNFSRAFAANGNADTSALLEDLRQSLRGELLLDRVPVRQTWLRISHEGQWAEEEAFVRARVKQLPTVGERDHSAVEFGLANAGATDPTSAVSDAYDRLEQSLRERIISLPGTGEEQEVGEIARTAAVNGFISAQTAEAITGLQVMRNLALRSTQHVSEQQAQDFLVLVDAVLYAMEHG